jgi:hypothetical protein
MFQRSPRMRMLRVASKIQTQRKVLFFAACSRLAARTMTISTGILKAYAVSSACGLSVSVGTPLVAGTLKLYALSCQLQRAATIPMRIMALCNSCSVLYCTFASRAVEFSHVYCTFASRVVHVYCTFASTVVHVYCTFASTAVHSYCTLASIAVEFSHVYCTFASTVCCHVL